MKKLTRYWIFNEPVGVYAPRILGNSNGYESKTEAQREVNKMIESDKRLGTPRKGQRYWILKGVPIFYKHIIKSKY